MDDVLRSDDEDAGEESLFRLVGDSVRELRRTLGLSRRQLSDRSGVSQRYLAKLEAGEGNISIALLRRVARALDHPMENLLSSMPSESARVARLFHGADAITRARVMQLLDPDRSRAGKAERICLVGLRGAGKSTLGTLIAADLGLAFVELTTLVESRAGMPIAEVIALYGQDGYRALEAAAVQEVVDGNTGVVLAAAGGIVVEDDSFADVLTHFHTVWIKASPLEHMARVRGQGDLRPMDGNPQAMAQLRQILRQREAKYAQADFVLDTTDQPVAASHRDLLALLRGAGICADRLR